MNWNDVGWWAVLSTIGDGLKGDGGSYNGRPDDYSRHGVFRCVMDFLMGVLVSCGLAYMVRFIMLLSYFIICGGWGLGIIGDLIAVFTVGIDLFVIAVAVFTINYVCTSHLVYLNKLVVIFLTFPMIVVGSFLFCVVMERGPILGIGVVPYNWITSIVIISVLFLSIIFWKKGSDELEKHRKEREGGALKG